MAAVCEDARDGMLCMICRWYVSQNKDPVREIGAWVGRSLANGSLVGVLRVIVFGLKL
jgi:hypothetical protein